MSLTAPQVDEIPFGACAPQTLHLAKKATAEVFDARDHNSTAISELDLIPDQKVPQIFEF
jgi:hypothetical protein